MVLQHGGDWRGFAAAHGEMPLDFSANVSPLGVPHGVVRAICDAASRVDRYPDPLCRDLIGDIARSEHVPAAWIACGNGAADLIFRLVMSRRPRRALLAVPTFSEYEAALRAVGSEVAYYQLSAERGFRLDESFLNAIGDGTDMVFLCQPNNPTGVSTPRSLVERIAHRCAEVGAQLVVDECFVDFMDDPSSASIVDRLVSMPEVVVLRAFTKLYAMAGVRLGYCICSNSDTLQRLLQTGQAWSVSTLAQEAGRAAIRESAYVERVRLLVREERAFLVRRLQDAGLDVIPPEANYVFFRCGVPLAPLLEERGIMLRDCSNYRGLDVGWYRCAVRGRADNERLLGAIEEAIA